MEHDADQGEDVDPRPPGRHGGGRDSNASEWRAGEGVQLEPELLMYAVIQRNAEDSRKRDRNNIQMQPCLPPWRWSLRSRIWPSCWDMTTF